MEHPIDTGIRIHLEDPSGLSQMTNSLSRQFEGLNPGWQKPAFIVCIGTDRSTGDSLGPLVGTRLQNLERGLFRVYGTLEAPVHANNLAEIMDSITQQTASPFILAVDACLGKTESVGYISVKPGPLYPGSGVNKCLPPVGDMSISGIVNVGGYLEFMVLQNTRLSLVMKMAKLIAQSIYYAACRCTRLKAVSSPVNPEWFLPETAAAASAAPHLDSNLS
jgi:putative sporulation protein YyaC